MRQKLSLKNENRGASLLAVLVVLVVVSAIAVVITGITITNIQMKEVERGTKKNFYSAEEVMENLHTGAAGKSADAMKAAYENVMQNYIYNQKNGKDLQKEFQVQYMAELENIFWDGTAAKQQKLVDSGNPATADNLVYSISKYNPGTLKDCISEDTADAVRDYLKTTSADADYDVDYKTGTLTLKNIKVVFKKASSDYETTITTNFVFSTPQMNFTGGSQMKEFMKYSLIADHMVNVDTSMVTVGGNVYAGPGGIQTATNGEGTFTGRTLITRGDIVANKSSLLTLGTGSTAIWAENIEVNGIPKGISESVNFDSPEAMETYKDVYTLTVNGNCYVADDLSLNGAKSRVKLTGNYYGYNFQENYAGSDISKDAKYSSAMIVNGKKSKLSLEDLNYLMLAGRTFISRGELKKESGDSVNDDVMMGESIAARTNQLAYYVPSDYVMQVSNPDDYSEKYTKFTEDGKAKFQEDTGINNILNYVNATNNVVAYYYVDSAGGTRVNYYLNFQSEEKANEYFAAYCSGKMGKANQQYASRYLTEDAIILDTNRIFTLAGDVMYRSGSGKKLEELPGKIDSRWTDTSGTYFKYSQNLAMQYKSLELGLTTSGQGVTADKVRFKDETKTENPMFDKLIDRAALKELVKKGTPGEGTSVTTYVPVSTSSSGGQVTLVDNDATNSSAYKVSNGYKGIVVATGNVKVENTFSGLIISGGTITFGSNAVVSSNESMIVDLFAEDLSKDAPLFSQIFNDYKSGGLISGLTDGKVDVNTYVSYEKWKKS